MTREEFHNRYNLDHNSGKSGSFGTVYRTYDNYRDEWKAVKVAQIKRIGEKEYSLEKEFGITKDLAVHKNVANYEAVYRFNEVNGEFSYAVMQYYSQGNLKELLQRVKLTLQQKKEVAKGIILGTEYLHQHGILHRDIKPNNILIAQKGDQYIPKITDFGISKNIDGSDLTNTGIGWTAYSSPELLKGVRLTEASDLWSIGIIVYELFVGHHPFRDPKQKVAPDETLRALNRAIVQHPTPSNVSQLPYPFNEIVNKYLQKQPQDRSGSVAHLFTIRKEEQPVVVAQPKVVLNEDTIPVDRVPKKKKRKPVIAPLLGQVGGAINNGTTAVGSLLIGILRGIQRNGAAIVNGISNSVSSGVRGIGGLLGRGIQSAGKGSAVVARSAQAAASSVASSASTATSGVGGILARNARMIAMVLLVGLLSVVGYQNKEYIGNKGGQVASGMSNGISSGWASMTTWFSELGSTDDTTIAENSSLSNGGQAGGGESGIGNPSDGVQLVKTGLSESDDEGSRNRSEEQRDDEQRDDEQGNGGQGNDGPSNGDSKSRRNNIGDQESHATTRGNEASADDNGSIAEGSSTLSDVKISGDGSTNDIANGETNTQGNETLKEGVDGGGSEERGLDIGDIDIVKSGEGSKLQTSKSGTLKNGVQDEGERSKLQTSNNGESSGKLESEISDVKTTAVRKKAPPKYFTNLLAEMIAIPSGEFTWGCDSFDDKCDDDEGSGERLSMQGFEMMANEVTQRQYQEVMGRNPSKFERCPNCPVESVSWYDAQSFVKKLNEIDPDFSYKLPTEKEWEYAATANSNYVFSGGNKKDFDYIARNRYNSNGRTNDIGLRRPNKFGLYDMTGNVSEWCADSYERTSQKSIRGGSYMDKENNSRINNRRAADPGSKFPWIGFRVMRKRKA